MTKKVEEKKSRDQIYFEVIDPEDEKNPVKKIFYMTRIQKHEKDNKNYFLILGEKDGLNLKIYEFLNFELSNKPENSKRVYLTALKLLLSYEEIIEKDLLDFKKADIDNLIDFLKGYSFKGNKIHFFLKTKRSNNTVNIYLSVYRKFLTFLGEKNTYLNEATGNYYLAYNKQNDSVIAQKQYAANLKVYKPIQEEVPYYISYEKYNRIQSEIETHFGLQEKIITSLMYECGLRIGEVLGLTLEDLTVESIDGDNPIPVIYIRNRVSDDKTFQSAKKCMKVTDREQYKSPEYTLKNYGYETVYPSEELYEMMNTYIERVHGEFIKKNLYYLSTADKVTDEELFYGNHYIFLNRNGTILSNESWNKILRKIFKNCNIKVDRGKKEHNLNHRFRHGHAMYLVNYLKTPELGVMRALRHSDINSTAKYYKPTISDQIKLKEKFTEDLYSRINRTDKL